MSREKLIYIASPYAGDIEANTAFAKKEALPAEMEQSEAPGQSMGMA